MVDAFSRLQRILSATPRFFLDTQKFTERSFSQLNESLYTLQVELDYLYESRLQ